MSAATPDYYEGNILPALPNALQNSEVCSTMPVSNSWPERGVGKLRSVKTMAGRL